MFLARELYRTVPEPLRGGQSRLEPGVVDLHLAAAGRSRAGGPGRLTPISLPRTPRTRSARRPDARGPSRIRRSCSNAIRATLNIVDAVRYILSIPTNILMIVSSSLGYFFFSGLTTFALLFVRGHYHAIRRLRSWFSGLLVGGALIGTLVGGRITDSLVHRGC